MLREQPHPADRSRVRELCVERSAGKRLPVRIDLGNRREVRDLRSSPEFARYRHEIWELLHDEVARAQRLEVAR